MEMTTVSSKARLLENIAEGSFALERLARNDFCGCELGTGDVAGAGTCVDSKADASERVLGRASDGCRTGIGRFVGRMSDALK